MRWNAKPSRRDENEPGIVEKLIAGGCTVLRLPGVDGEVDLLVGRDRVDLLVEIKMPDAGKRLTRAQLAPGGEFHGCDPRLGEKQARWMMAWRGSEPIVADDAAPILAELERRARARRRPDRFQRAEV